MKPCFLAKNDIYYLLCVGSIIRRLVKVFQIMKRYNNLFDKIVSLDNLYLADIKARRNKGHRQEVEIFD